MDVDNAAGKSGSSIVTLEPYSSPEKTGGRKSQFGKQSRLGNGSRNEKFRKLEILPGVYEIVNYEKFLIIEFGE